MWGLWASAARVSAFGSRADVRTKPITQNEAAKSAYASCLLLAQSEHHDRVEPCLLSEVKRT
jgi:hypothetical protein